jgi:hypothetical protein
MSLFNIITTTTTPKELGMNLAIQVVFVYKCQHKQPNPILMQPIFNVMLLPSHALDFNELYPL